VLAGLFGVQATLYDGITASTALADWQPEARFSGLRYQGQAYDYLGGTLLRHQPR
jgi:hypothetical protein